MWRRLAKGNKCPQTLSSGVGNMHRRERPSACDPQLPEIGNVDLLHSCHRRLSTVLSSW